MAELNIPCLESLWDFENDKLKAEMEEHKDNYLKNRKCNCKVSYFKDGKPFITCIHYKISRGKRFKKRALKLLNQGMFLSAYTFETVRGEI